METQTDKITGTILGKVPMIVFAAVSIAIFVFSVQVLPKQGVDHLVLYKAGETLLSGSDPYSMELKFYTPAWSLAFLAPMSLLPIWIARVFWAAASLLVWVVFLVKVLRMKYLDATIFLLNPFFLYGMILGSYDWLVILGLMLPAWIGSWFVMLKPQIGLGWMVWFLNKNFKKAVYTYAPPIVLLGLLVLFGLYRPVLLGEMWWNWSLGLLGIPFGLAMVWTSFKGEDPTIALAASPFLSPYVAVQSWAVALLLFKDNRPALLGAVLFSWVIVFIRINLV